MIETVPLKGWHILEVLANDPKSHYLKDSFNEQTLFRLEKLGVNWTILDNGRPIMVGGLILWWNHRAELWSLLDARTGSQMLAIHRRVLKYVETCPVRRLELVVRSDFPAGHKWARLLGFALEAPAMKAYGVDGSENSLYARVR